MKMNKYYILLLCVLFVFGTSSCNSNKNMKVYEERLEATIENYYTLLQLLYLTDYARANHQEHVIGVSYDSMIVCLLKELDKIESQVMELRKDADDIQTGMKDFYLYDYKSTFNSIKSYLMDRDFYNAIEATKKCLESIYSAKTFFHYKPKFYEEGGRIFL